MWRRCEKERKWQGVKQSDRRREIPVGPRRGVFRQSFEKEGKRARERAVGGRGTKREERRKENRREKDDRKWEEREGDAEAAYGLSSV